MPDLISVSTRFTRAVHIRRDFHDLRHRLDGYLVTPLVQQTATRIFRALDPNSRERAFSIIGPFGAGKSAFALFLAHFLQRHPHSRYQLLSSLHADAQAFPVDSPSLLAILVPGNNTSLRYAVIQALIDALQRTYIKVPDFVRSAANATSLDPEKVAEVIEKTAQYIKDQGNFSGIILVIDELGQYLDYAARHDDERDLFVLQTLAEAAARSGETPILVVTILHQAFEHYTTFAGPRRRIEWAKVQGRFIDLVFQEPLSQMVRLIAASLRPSRSDQVRLQRQQWAEQIAPLTEELNLRPAEIGYDEWKQIISDCFPLHPMTLLALPGIVRQLAQNERSLFAFLSSDEPWGLRDVLKQATKDNVPIYRLTHLFLYVETNLGTSLFARSRGRRWVELVEARTNLDTDDSSLLDTLTVVGVLGALERAAGMRACQAHVAFALADNPTDRTVANALERLQERKRIIYRRFRDSFVLWEGSDLDIETLTQSARKTVAERFSLCQLLNRYTDITPRIAHRHSYQTGATRIFAIRYADINQIAESPSIIHKYDGEILHIVPTNEEELAKAHQWATDTERINETARIVIIPKQIHELYELTLDTAALRLLLEENHELEHDRVARREVSSRLIEAEQILQETINKTFGIHNYWFYCGKPQTITNERQVDNLLSQAADITYELSPRIWNELIVRDTISSTIAKARRNLVEALLTRSDQELLGFTGYPPERAMYESIFQAGGLHRQRPDGSWEIGAPPADDPLHLLPVWRALETKLLATETTPLSLSEVYTHLQQPPYGVKAGLLPLLFVAFYVARSGELIFYEHGNYVPMPDMAMFERLLSRPQYFAVRLCQAQGARLQVYQRLATHFAPQALQQHTQPALLSVAIRILRIYHQLPSYSKQTKRISVLAQLIRSALREARAPDELLFVLLPKACQMHPFGDDNQLDVAQIDRFIDNLRQGLQELQEAFPNLCHTIVQHTMAAFDLAGDPAQAHFDLLRRYQRIVHVINEPQLHALGARLETALPNGEAWATSLAALVVKRPPDQWHDEDIPVFQAAIRELAQRFYTAEELALYATQIQPPHEVLRIGITNGKGEVSRIIHLYHDTSVQKLQDEIKKVLSHASSTSKEQQLSALIEVLQSLLETK
ncbi:MAG: hypothetical protein WHS83_11005 [Chloroflexus sp.]|uniref:hypothetical protein n=1 Tax=Chloroflexus sp. TaxID=1904827 RepID=UPI0030949C02